uniref:Uncharacterized protein n=1 Tax=Anopheles atroparvus TaxID=41427 RepID=A0A182JMU2_ANOAO
MVGELCGVCKGEAKAKIVGCDQCDLIFHLSCVNEDESVYSRDWLCKDCISSAEETVPTVSSSPPPWTSLHTATPCRVTPTAARAPTNVSSERTPAYPSMMEEISTCFRQIMEEQPRPRAGVNNGPRMEDIVDAVMQDVM